MYIKNAEEIRILAEGGQRLATILSQVIKEIKPGVHTAHLEDLANELIEKAGGKSAFKNYPMGGDIFFPSTLCISVNDEVVHGSAIPDRVLNNGDIVDIDVGMEWPASEELRQEFKAPLNPHSANGGFFTDTCRTVAVGKIGKDLKKLISITKRCLDLAVKEVRPGASINDIARVIQKLAEDNGYGVVRDLVGHGVGYFAHEEPNIFHFEIDENSPENIRLEEGMVIAIEPMINLGTWQVKTAKDGYTVITKDGLSSAHFEHTIAVTKDGYRIITNYE